MARQDLRSPDSRAIALARLRRVRRAGELGAVATRRAVLAAIPASAACADTRAMLRRRPYTAGQSAERYYREALREWGDLPALRWMRLGSLAMVTAGCMIEMFWVGHIGAWLLGLATAMCAFGYAAASGWAPAHIENWKTGADAERRTEKTLRVLERDGWHAVHDLTTPFGNIDHVVVGPGGVFLLDSKEPHGRVSVVGDVMHVARRANPRGAYTNAKAANAARGAAWALSRQISDVMGRRQWVYAAVVLWSPFEQRVVQANRVAFVHADELVSWLRDQPVQLGPEQVAAIAAVVRTRAERDGLSVVTAAHA